MAVVPNYRRVDGYQVPINDGQPNSLIISYRFPITLLQTTFKPTSSNLRDQFDYFIRSSAPLGTVSTSLSSGTSDFTVTFNSDQRFRTGWHLVYSRRRVSSVVGEIINVETGISGRNRTVTLTIQRSVNDPIDSNFATQAPTQIRYAIPLMLNISIINEDPIIYDASQSTITISEDQDLMITYSTGSRDRKSLFLTIDFLYGLLTT
jgi:hypothetical protein